MNFDQEPSEAAMGGQGTPGSRQELPGAPRSRWGPPGDGFQLSHVIFVPGRTNVGRRVKKIVFP